MNAMPFTSTRAPAIAAVAALAIGVGLLVLTFGGQSLEDYAIGTWSCSAAELGHVDYYDAFERDVEFPTQFDAVADQFDPSLTAFPNQTYTDAHEVARVDFLTGIVTVRPGGTFDARWTSVYGSFEEDGEWAINDGVPVITNDSDEVRAADITVGQSHGILLNGDRFDTRLHELDIAWVDDGFTATLSRSFAYEISCTRLSDVP